MTRTNLAALILVATASSAAAQTDERLVEITAIL